MGVSELGQMLREYQPNLRKIFSVEEVIREIWEVVSRDRCKENASCNSLGMCRGEMTTLCVEE